MFFMFRKQKNKLLYRLFTVGLSLLGGVSLYYQFDALKPAPQKYQTRNLAALALAMNINDEDTIKTIFPSSEFPLSVTQSAMNKGYGIFGAYPFSDIRKKLGQVSTIDRQGICLGALDKVAPIAGIPDYARVTGWIFNSNTMTVPQRLSFLNPQNLISGFAITGLYREDVARIIHPKAEFSGFYGYVKSAVLADVLTTLGEETGCTISFAPQPLPQG
jgi:hypothetical protein